ncbi:hypothetical protein ACIHQR_23175 [Corallococcus coralloides]|uniref:hypothetical protein n=1 Tax=Corallococcus coralloides TaxID=184914 RepID=UPI00384E14E2
MKNNILDTIDRQFDFISTLKGDDFLSELRRCLLLLENEPETSAILTELRQEARELSEKYLQSEEPSILRAAALGEKLLDIVPALKTEASAPELSVPEILQTPSAAEAWRDGLAGFFSSARTRKTASNYRRAGDPSILHVLTSILTKRTRDILNPGETTELGLKGAHLKLTEIHEIHTEAIELSTQSEIRFKSLIHDQRCHPGMALALIEHAMIHMMHGYSSEPPAWLKKFMEQELSWNSVLSGIRPARASRLSDVDFVADEIRHAEVILQKQAKRVHNGLKNRLGTLRTLQSIIYRFKERCEWHDRSMIARIMAEMEIEEKHRKEREAVQIKEAMGAQKAALKKKAQLRQRRRKEAGDKLYEDRLTQELARWLFDAGLRPILKPRTAGVEPDVYGDFPADKDWPTPYTLYVEAKLASDKVDINELIKKGMRQFHGTVHRLRGERPSLTEAFFVVFRSGGRRIEFPLSCIRLEGWCFFPVLIDLARGEKSGSREPEMPVLILEKSLRPISTEEI